MKYHKPKNFCIIFVFAVYSYSVMNMSVTHKFFFISRICLSL